VRVGHRIDEHPPNRTKAMTDNTKTAETSTFQKALEEAHYYLDIPIRVSIKLGRCTMKIREILQLQPGSIVELPKSAGENVDVFINENLLGFGEVLGMEGATGVRITDFYTHA
jgi:flagellar motor switch protein FliN